VLSEGAFGQQSVRTPEAPLYHTFATEAGLFRAGPFSGTADVALDYSFNDNANTTNGTANPTGTGKVSLNQIAESIDLDLVWVLSPLNQIAVQLGGELQENFYSNGTTALNIAIRPGSQFHLQATVGDVRLQAYEQFAIVQDPVTDPTVADQTNLNRLTNTIGLSATVPLYRAEVSLELDYTYSDVLGGSNTSSAFSQQEVAIVPSSLHIGSTIGFEVAPSLSLGAEMNATFNTGGGASDFNVLSGGGFLRGHLTPLIGVDTGAGILTGEGPGVGKPQFYAYLSAGHQVSRNLQLLVGITRDVSFSSGEGVSLNNEFYIAARLNASPRWIITASPFVNFGDVATGTLPGRYTQYGMTVDSSYLLSGHISIDLNYRYAKREGSAGSYTQNLFGLAVTYKFGARGE
jgi:hypothetical protein